MVMAFILSGHINILNTSFYTSSHGTFQILFSHIELLKILYLYLLTLVLQFQTSYHYSTNLVDSTATWYRFRSLIFGNSKTWNIFVLENLSFKISSEKVLSHELLQSASAFNGKILEKPQVRLRSVPHKDSHDYGFLSDFFINFIILTWLPSTNSFIF